MIRNSSLFNDNLPAGFDGVFDWDFLIECFAPTKIQPMDFDAVVERNGHFLIFETKPENTEIPLGQKLTLERIIQTNMRLSRGSFTVFLLYGKDTVYHKFDIWYPNGRKVTIPLDDNPRDTIKERVRGWFEYAEQAR